MSLTLLRKMRFDVVIDFDDVMNYERLHLLHKLSPSHVIGFNKPTLHRYSPNLTLLDADQHISERHRQVLLYLIYPLKRSNII